MNEGAKQKSYLETLKKAYSKLDEMQAKLRAAEQQAREPIAIVGMGCRFPGGGDTPESFWDLLRDGKDAVIEIPRERWDVDRYYDSDPDAPGKMSTRWGAFLPDIDKFDPRFFGITPREAVSMDPQQRLLLEVCWEALENAGRAPDALAGTSVGVFIGIIGEEYAQIQTTNGGIDHINAYYGSGTASSIASGRIAYILGFQGPAISIDTSCSSSLVAVHLACQSLHSKECSMALAGGVNLMLLPDATIALTKHRLMASDGHCKTCDASADGYVRGEGCGVVVLKRLSDAISQKDRIIATILGTAINQDGASSGLTAPHGPAQQAVIKAALKKAGISPADIGYVEMHGTGTALGDPIEVQALGAVLGENRSAARPVFISTVKTNIGHVEAAAGIAGLIKAVLVLQHKEIPPHLNLKNPNALIPWDKLPVTVPVERVPWPQGAPLVAGVSSFGFSGTNVHMIVSVPDEQPAAVQDDRPWNLLCLSAKSEPELKELGRRFGDYLSGQPQSVVGDVCFSANAGRAQLSHRLTVLASSTAELREKLKAFHLDQEVKGVEAGVIEDETPPRVAFLFTGQGSQYVGMGRLFYQTQPTFRRVLDHCNELLKADLHRSLISVLYPESGESEEVGNPLSQTIFSQTALFSLEYALFELWRSWGVRPAAVMGHSVGEYVAACVAGVMTLEDGLKLIGARARLMQGLPPGGQMAAVFADEAKIADMLERSGAPVSIAAVNGPGSVVISGPGRDVEAILDRLAADGSRFTRLQVSHAFHSPLMEPMLAEFSKVAGSLTYAAPEIHFISNVSGRAFSGQEPIDPSYWCHHVTQPVRFYAAMQELHRLGYRKFLEIGPHPVLAGMGANCLTDDAIRWLPSLKRECNDWLQMLSSLSELFRSGVRVDWDGFDRDYAHRRLALPTYPFQRKQYWVHNPSTKGLSSYRSDIIHPLLGFQISSALKTELYENKLRGTDFQFVLDHRVQDTTIMPAAAFIEMGLAAARSSWHSGPLVFEKVFIHEPLSFEADREYILQTILTPLEDDLKELQIFSADSSLPSDPAAAGVGELGWRLHFSGSIHRGDVTDELKTEAGELLEQVRLRCPTGIDARTHYQQLKYQGFDFGPSLKTLVLVQKGNMEALGDVRYTDQDDQSDKAFNFPPALLDGCLQFFWTLLPEVDGSGSYLPMSFEEFTVLSNPRGALWSHILLRPDARQRKDMIVGDVSIYSSSGYPVAFMKGLAFRKATRETLVRARMAHIKDWFYEVRWETSEEEIARATLSGRPVEAAELLLAPNQIAEFIYSRVNLVSETERLKLHYDLISGIENLSTSYIFQALKTLGWEIQKGEHVSAEGLRKKLRIEPKYERLLNRIMEILVDEQILRPDQGGWQVLNSPDPTPPESLLEELSSRQGAASCPQLELTTRCGRKLSEALTGQADPLALLFPGGSLDQAAQLYSETPEARVFNSLVRDAVVKALQNYPHGRKARILELGAGTGGATAFVLPGLPQDRVEYFFTDLSPVFLRRAAQRFETFGFVNYQLCDIERGPEEQGFKPRSFDIVIAMNMLHATHFMQRSLENVRRFLSPGGIMVLLEGTAPERWIDITFGLTDGWWAFKDTELRPSYPLLSRRQWIKVLKAAGFEDAVTVPESFDLSQQAVIIARNPLVGKEQIEQCNDREGIWVVFSDGDGIGTALSERIAGLGENCVTVSTGRVYEHPSSKRWSLAADRQEDYHRLFEEMRREHLTNVRGVVHLWSLEIDPPSIETTISLEAAQLRGSGSLLYLLQAVAAVTGWSRPPQLFVVTKGAQATEKAGPSAFYQAPILGLGKVVMLEHPDLDCHCIDLDPAVDIDSQADRLMVEIRSRDSENLVAYRDGRRLVPRLRRLQAQDLPPSAPPADGFGAGSSVRLEKSPAGLLEDMSLVPAQRRAPGRGEVEIRVHAAGLGFRDVMNALGMFDDPEPLGYECAGRVVRIGPGVETTAEAEAVVALARGSLATYVIADARLIVPKPPSLGFAEAATLPATFLTAHYALNHIGRIAAGEKILIHAAAGGVGTAAVQLALRAGAEVFGTAGSAQKRAFLTSLGVQHVMDSRSLDFAAQIMQATAGRGVDAVLNSLSGEFITASLSCLAAGGRFLEIGVRGILTSDEVRRLRPDVRYHILELADVTRHNPELTQQLLSQVMTWAGEGAVQPLPMTNFSLSQASDAFRYMAKARHIGRVVIVDDRVPDSCAGVRIHPDAAYVVTGGLSGLGLLTARWLVDKGARHLALIGRSPAGAAAETAVAAMKATGAQVLVLCADVSRRDALARAFEEIEGALPPVRGIIHSAGTLADGVLMKQDWERFKRVMAPKVDGAWNLHILSEGLPLDFFILYSSTAGLLGSPGQGNHAAANAFLDALAHYRRARGLPAQSINWGVWSDVGSAAERRADKRIALQGVDAIKPAQGLEALERVMGFGSTQAAVIPIDWRRFLPRYAGGITPAWLSPMKAEQALSLRKMPRSAAPKARAPRLLQDLQSLPASQRRERVQSFIAVRIKELLGTDSAAALDPRRPLSEQGVDSLMAVEVRNMLKSSLGLPRNLPATLVFDYPTVEDLAVFICGQLGDADEAQSASGQPAGKAQPSENHNALDAIEQLSDDDIERLLAEKSQLRPDKENCNE
jgi:acyl transferase domain-containing protein/NADPH:quinone reductase-like Zn-dependent oxidoreductase/SAM-dependent methyltransferase/NADP-dependent 3-hydroxy acid dehydrogenase YdfG